MREVFPANPIWSGEFDRGSQVDRLFGVVNVTTVKLIRLSAGCCKILELQSERRHMQPPLDPFAALGLSSNTVKTGASTQPEAASASTYNYANPPMISSDASYTSMSSSVTSVADASSVVSSTSTRGAIQPQNPFDNLIPAPSGTGVPSSSPVILSQSLSSPVVVERSPLPVILSTVAPPTPPPHSQPMMSPPPTAISPSLSQAQSHDGSTSHSSPPRLLVSQQTQNGISASPSPPVPQLREPLNSVILFDDDENTEPSSAANTLEQPNTSGISRFLENTKRLMTSTSRRDSEDNENGPGSVISGYLQKLGRNGKWQTRWFETDGECLSYYKSDKRFKLLATLDLQKVGLIEVDSEDKSEFSFRIQVLGRLYHLRANSRASCRDWVITLNRVKEASMKQGNVKLVGGSALSHLSALDLLNTNPTPQLSATPRVVVVSNRQRTRAVDQDESPFDQIMRVDNPEDDPSDPAYNPHSRRSTLSTVVVARWTKHQTSLQRIGTKVGVWARSLKKYSCVDGVGGADGQVQPNAVYLDRHVHPPGHDDKKQPRSSKLQPPSSPPGEPQNKGYGRWLEHDTPSEALVADDSSNYPPDTELVVGIDGVTIKPMTIQDRSTSSASSDYDSRMIS